MKKNKHVKKNLKNRNIQQPLSQIIIVKNAEGEPDTKAQVLVQNKISYTPKVSVIIPVYNVAEYLRECLDSVINQTLKEIEIICVDDGSTDNSLEILKEYAAKDKRITILKQKNLHAGVARNAGLAVACGEYLSFLDSDDVFKLNMLEDTSKKADEDDSDVVIYSAHKKDYQLNKMLDMPWLCKHKDGILYVDDIKDKVFDLTSPNCWNKLFRRKNIQKHKLHFQNLLNANDVYFSYMAVILAEKLSILNTPFVLYRYNTGKQITSRLSELSPSNIYLALKAVKESTLKYRNDQYLQYEFHMRCIYSLLYQQKMAPTNFMKYLKLYKTLFSPTYSYLFNDYFCTEDHLPIVFSTNDTYIKYLSVAIISLRQCVQDIPYHIFVLYDRLTHKNISLIKTLETEKVKITFICVDKYIDKYALYEKDYFTKEMYFRFLIPTIFKNYHKVLYLDCDIVVKKDVYEIFQTRLGDKYLACCKDLCSARKIENIKTYLKTNPANYFNSGVLLFNVDVWNKLSIHKKCFEYVEQYKNLMCPDQDILNMICEKNVYYLDTKWNYLWHYNFIIENEHSEDFINIVRQYNAQENQVNIVHYSSNKKPWNVSHRLADIWWKYAIKSPFYKEIKKSSPMLVVSLTSYPARINTVDQTIKSLLNQTIKAHKVILWLAPEQFPNKEKDLPQQLLNLQNQGLTIDWYHDIRSYKKLIPTLKKYPKAIIVTADDDNIYQPHWLEKLYASYQKYPKDIHCHRVTKFYHNNMGFHIIPGGHDYYVGASFLNKLVGLGGVLYPPNCFYKDILDEDLIMRLAPTNDDQWFWFQGILNNVKVRVVNNPDIKAHYIPGTQETGLTQINDKGEKLFWKDFGRLINYYPKAKEKLLKENKKYKTTRYSQEPYKQALQIWYQKVTGTYLNLDNPRTFNEKIQWLKLYDSTPIKTRLADKYLVREWIKEKIGEKYLIPLLGVFDKFEDIDFNKLPNRFVIKCNHGSGWNIIVKDKSKLDLRTIKEKLDKWLHTNFAFLAGYELHYKNMSPKIIIEQYKEDDSGDLRDYKFLCFNGKVKYIWVDGERYSEHKRNLYDLEWNLIDKKIGEGKIYPNIDYCPKPHNLNKMIEFATLLSKGFPFVRVDFFESNKQLYFGEMTFTSASGIHLTEPKSFILELGNLIKLPTLAYNIDTGEYYKLPKKSKIKPYLLFPYYLWQKAYFESQKKSYIEKIALSQFLSSRIDIKNNGKENNAIAIKTTEKLSSPTWFKNSLGQGQVLETNKEHICLSIKAIQDGKLSLSFKGQDKRFEGARIPLWIDYTSIKINGKEILSAPIEAWHDKPFLYKMPVKDGETVLVEIEQQPHKYSRVELKDIIFKLFPNDAYIRKNIDKILLSLHPKHLLLTTEEKILETIQAEHFISLGDGCRPAFWLRSNRLRDCALPFDWMLTFPLSLVLSSLKLGCNNWFTNYKENVLLCGSKHRHVTDEVTGMVSLHAFPKETPISSYLPEFHDIFQRRLERLRTILETSKNVTFLSNRKDSVQSFVNFAEQLHVLYPSLRFNIINITYKEIEDVRIEKLKLAQFCNIYNICAKDINEHGATKDINPSRFWIGNEKLWNWVCSKLTLTSSFQPSRLFSITKSGSKTMVYVLGIKLEFNNKQKELLLALQQNQQTLLQALNTVTRRGDKLEQQNIALSQQVTTVNRELQQVRLWLKQTHEMFPALNKQLANAQETLLSQLVTERKVNRLAAIVSMEIKRQRKHHKEIESLLSKFICSTQADLHYLKNLDIAKSMQLHKTAEELTQRIMSSAQIQEKHLDDIQNAVISNRKTLQELKAVDVAKVENLQKNAQQLETQIMTLVQNQEKQLNTVAECLHQQQEKSLAGTSQLSNLLETLQKNNQNEQEAIKKHLHIIQNKALQQYNELNFADLLHDSTQNTPWFKDKTLSLYSWAANYSFIYTLFRILDKVSPLHILEMGLGQTTRLTSQYIAYKNPNATLDVCEHNQDWIDIYVPELPKSSNIKVHHLDLEYFDHDGKKNDKYKNLAQVTGNIKYNLIIVDGPVGGGKNFPRSNIIDLIPQNLAKDFIIIFDDAERAGEQNTIAQTKAKLSAQGIAFGTQQRNALKSQFLIFSKSCEFVQYL